MRDIIGKPIRRGDVLAVAGRRANSGHLQIYDVIDVTDDGKLKVWNRDKVRRATLTNSAVLVIGADDAAIGQDMIEYARELVRRFDTGPLMALPRALQREFSGLSYDAALRVWGAATQYPAKDAYCGRIGGMVRRPSDDCCDECGANHWGSST